MKVKNVVLAIGFSCLVPSAEGGSAVTGSAWLDAFVGPDGAVIYPQYSWAAKGRLGTLSGYGFVEEAPREPFFTNHLAVYCPPSSPLCLHTETGGSPEKGTFHFQAAPRVNIHTLIPPIRKVLGYLFVAQLPGFVGDRPPNTLLSLGTKRFPVDGGVEVSFEGYRRFFPGGRPDYSEYWLLVHPKGAKALTFAIFALHDGRSVVWAAGIRLTTP